MRGQIIGADILQHTAVAADRRADEIADIGVGHGDPPGLDLTAGLGHQGARGKPMGLRPGGAPGRSHEGPRPPAAQESSPAHPLVVVASEHDNRHVGILIRCPRVRSVVAVRISLLTAHGGSRPAFRLAVNADCFAPFDQLRVVVWSRSDFLFPHPHRPIDGPCTAAACRAGVRRIIPHVCPPAS